MKKPKLPFWISRRDISGKFRTVSDQQFNYFSIKFFEKCFYQYILLFLNMKIDIK